MLFFGVPAFLTQVIGRAGIILFNMGLFEKLNNESEAAFIISHDNRTFLLKHSENAMSAYVTAINSEEVQGKLRQIKGTVLWKTHRLIS